MGPCMFLGRGTQQRMAVTHGMKGSSLICSTGGKVHILFLVVCVCVVECLSALAELV